MLVYVLSKKGKSLMPTNRFCHIKKLLKNGKAMSVCNNPFTIKLKYETPDIVQPLTCGIDVGRENIGIGVSNEEGECIFLCNVKTNNKQVKQNMAKRKAHRQERRRNHRQKKQRRALSTNNAMKKGNNNTLRSKKDCLSKEVSYPRMEESFRTFLYEKKSVSKGDYQQTKGPGSRQKLNTKKINSFKKFDKVKYLGREYFIKGRMSSGYAILMDIHGEKADFSNFKVKTPKLANCKRIAARKTTLVVQSVI
jgi:hypothetical protein